MYLITYSRADLEKIQTRETFSEVETQAWMAATGVKTKQWVVAWEYHSDASSSEAQNSGHFHMALKLEKRTRWIRVRKFLDDSYGIKVNFSSHYNTSYYSAYKNTTKDNADALHSNDHPALKSAPPPKTEQAIHSNKRRGQSSGSRKKYRQKGTKAWPFFSNLPNKI